MIICGIASIATREKHLFKAVGSLLPQVDKIFVVLNNYPHTPRFLNNDKIKVFHAENEIGDAEKFRGLKFAGLNDVYISADDDLQYAKTYVRTLLNGLDKYNIVSLHGRRIIFPFRSFLKSSRSIVHCLNKNNKDQIIDIPGTGVCAINLKEIDLKFEDFKYKNCADIQLAIKAKEQDVKICGIKHDGKMVRYILGNNDNTIYRDTEFNDSLQTQLIRDNLL